MYQLYIKIKIWIKKRQDYLIFFSLKVMIGFQNIAGWEIFTFIREEKEMNLLLDI